jgi:hypothetical protein
MSEAVVRRDDLGSGQRILPAVCVVGVVALLLIYCLSAANRYLVNDDYQILYTAWLRSTGQIPGRDFGIYSYHLLVDLLEPVFVVFPRSLVPLWVGRALMLATLAGIAWLLISLGNRLFGKPAGYVAAVLALASQALLYRALDLRPDLLTTLIWLAMLGLLLDERLLERRRLVLLGVLAGIVFLNRFKSALIFPVVVLLLAQRAWEASSDRRSGWRVFFRAAVVSGVASLIPLGLYACWLVAHHELRTYLEVNFALAGVVENAVVRSPKPLRMMALGTTFSQDSLLWILAALGIAARAINARRFDSRTNTAVAGTLALAIASVVLNPAYYVYNLVTLVPLIALFAAYPVAMLVRDGSRTHGQTLAIAVLSIPFLTGWRTMAREAVDRTIAHQLALNQFIQRYTAPTSHIFAMEGVGLFRPSIYHWRMPEVLLARYAAGGIDYAHEIREAAPEIIIVSYRLPGWLLPRDRAFFMRHYVPLTPLVAVQGHSGGGEAPGEETFELLSSGLYETVIAGPGYCRIDGVPTARDGQPVMLESGLHTLDTGARTTCAVRRFYPREARELIANPRQLPYLVSPKLASLPGA